MEQQQKVAEVLGGGPIAGYIVATLNEWNVVLETGVLILGFISGLFTVYFFVNRFIKERRAKRKE